MPSKVLAHVRVAVTFVPAQIPRGRVRRRPRFVLGMLTLSKAQSACLQSDAWPGLSHSPYWDSLGFGHEMDLGSEAATRPSKVLVIPVSPRPIFSDFF